MGITQDFSEVLTMRFPAFALCVALALSGGASFAADTPPSQQPATEKPAATPTTDDSQKVTCRHQETTGSRLGGRSICHTRAQWDTIDENNRVDNADALRAKLSGAQPQ